MIYIIGHKSFDTIFLWGTSKVNVLLVIRRKLTIVNKQ